MQTQPETPAPSTSTTPDCSTAINRYRGRRRILLLSLSLVGIVTVTGAVIRDDAPEELNLWTVKPTTFRESVESTGTVVPLRTERVASDCRWSTRILSIVPEGTWVQEGDVVCVLDSADVEEFLRERELRLIRARAGLDSSVQEELIEKTNSERRIAKAEFNLQDAEMELQEYMEGTWPEQLSKIDRELGVAESLLEGAMNEHEFNEYLWIQGHANASSLSRSSANMYKEDFAVSQLAGQRALLTQFSNPRMRLQLDYRQRNAEREVLRTKIATSLAETRARMNTLSDERRTAIYERYVEFARKSLEACTMRAPKSGQVIYSNSGYSKSRGRRDIEVGNSVTYRQGVFEIPDSDRFKVKLPLAEALIARVYNGMPAEVELAGYDDSIVAGEITYISRYPKARSRYIPGVRDYWLDVTLHPTEEQFQLLRNNTQAAVTLVLKEQPESLMIPRSAVFGLANEYFVWRMEGSDLVTQPVIPGDVQDSRVVIQEGLQQGDRVAIDLPSQQTRALEKLIGNEASL